MGDFGEGGRPVRDVAVRDKGVGDMWFANCGSGRRMAQHVVPDERVVPVDELDHSFGAGEPVSCYSFGSRRQFPVGWVEKVAENVEYFGAEHRGEFHAGYQTDAEAGGCACRLCPACCRIVVG